MKTCTLNTGYEMPLVGFGTYQLTDPKADEIAIITAIESGYRLIDTAQAYKNEEIVGATTFLLRPKFGFPIFPATSAAKALKNHFVNWISITWTLFFFTGRTTTSIRPGALWKRRSMTASSVPSAFPTSCPASS